MDWIDIASIIFVCVTANHLGLVEKITKVFFSNLSKIPIVSCPKCLTFWVTMVYGVLHIYGGIFGWGSVSSVTIWQMLAVSFLTAYSAIWLELFEGFIDTLYMKLYETIYPNNTNDALTAADFDDDTDCSVSDMQKADTDKES